MQICHFCKVWIKYMQINPLFLCFIIRENVRNSIVQFTKENWIEGGGDRVYVHFAVRFLDCWRTSFCVTTIIKIVNNNTNDKQTSDISGVRWRFTVYKLMFVYIRSAAFVIVVTQKLVLQQSKNVTAKCKTKITLSPPPSIQYLLVYN